MVNSDRIYELLTAMINCDDLSFSFKIRTISNLLTDADRIGALGLRYIELIDYMLRISRNNSDKKELMEIKLLALDTLYYSDEYLLNNNIDLRKCFLEYLDLVRYEGVSAREADVLGAYFIDKSYIQDIDKHLLKFLSDDEKVKLLFKLNQLNQQQLKNVIDYKRNNHIVQKISYYQKIRERFSIVIQMALMTHPQKADEFFYMLFPQGYSYECVRSDWYWTEKDSYDYYVDNGIISERESDVLYKIGVSIDNVDIEKNNAECNDTLHTLFCEFVCNRTPFELLFPDFLKHN